MQSNPLVRTLALVLLRSAPLYALTSYASLAWAQEDSEEENQVLREDDEEAAAAAAEAEAAHAKEEEAYDVNMSEGDGGRDENPATRGSDFGPSIGVSDSSDEESPRGVNGPYPIRLIARPQNLPQGMIEFGSRVPIGFDPIGAALTLGGTYGVTDTVEVGLRYSPGRYSETFSVGRAVAVESQYSLNEVVAAKVSVPLYLDPFALGLVVATPIKYTLFDKFSLVAGEKLLSITLKDFLPSVDNATQNDASLALRANNELLSAWVINLSGGAIYQVDDNLALDMLLSTRFDDTRAAATTGLTTGLLYARSNTFDMGATLGSPDLANLLKTLSLSIFLSFRI